MKRSTESFWLSGEKPTAFAPLQKNLRAELLIVGAGICGLSAAYFLSEAGKKVVVLDSHGLAAGETGHTTAHLTAVLDDRYFELEKRHGKAEAKLAWESHMEAIAQIEHIIKKEKIKCEFERVEGQLKFYEDQESELQKEKEAFERIAPGLVRTVGRTLHIQNQAQFHPLKYLIALHKILEARGVRFFQAQVTDFSEKKGVTLTTSKRLHVWGKDCIVATHSPVLNRFQLHTKLYPYRSYVLAARIPKDSTESGLFWDNLEAYHYVRVQKQSTHDLLIVGGEDHKTGQEKDTEISFTRLEKWALKHYPQINKIEYRWSGQVLETMDGLAFIGKNPGDEHTYVATGFSGNGLTYGTFTGLLFTDLILKRKNPWETLYRPSRKKLNGTYIKENFNVVCQYADLIPIGSSSLKGLKENEGRVIQENLQKVAVYKDELGKLHACSAYCSHLGCVVQWNPSEKCWDCPCHGSQFTPLGKVQHGPALTPLKKHKLKLS